jgi:hypothetical protein
MMKIVFALLAICIAFAQAGYMHHYQPPMYKSHGYQPRMYEHHYEPTYHHQPMYQHAPAPYAHKYEAEYKPKMHKPYGRQY